MVQGGFEPFLGFARCGKNKYVHQDLYFKEDRQTSLKKGKNKRSKEDSNLRF